MSCTASMLENVVGGKLEGMEHTIEWPAQSVIEWPADSNYDFTNVRSLASALRSDDVNFRKIAYWTHQIGMCFYYMYKKRRECPVQVDPTHIMIDAREDVICHTITYETQKSIHPYEVRFIDAMVRVHRSLMSYVDRSKCTGFGKSSVCLRIFDEFSTHMYAAVATRSDTCSVGQVMNAMDTMCTMSARSVFDNFASEVVESTGVWQYQDRCENQRKKEERGVSNVPRKQCPKAHATERQDLAKLNTHGLVLEHAKNKAVESPSIVYNPQMETNFAQLRCNDVPILDDAVENPLPDFSFES